MSLRLSIVIATKDRPGLLPQAVRSALLALPDEGEVLVVDDRSRQPAADVLDELNDPRLAVMVNRRAQGPGGARNFGVDRAQGSVILFLDDDDLMLPGYPGWVLSLASDPDAPGYGFSAALPFEGEPPSTRVFQPRKLVPISSRDFRHRLAAFSQGFWVRRDVFLELGGIEEDLRTNEDTEFSLHLLRRNVPGVYSEQPGVMVRRHVRQSTGSDLGHVTHVTAARARADCFAAIQAKHGDWLQDQHEAREYLMKRRLKLLAKARDSGAARAALMEPAADGMRLRLRAWWIANAMIYRLRGV